MDTMMMNFTLTERLNSGPSTNIFYAAFTLWEVYIYVLYDLADPKTANFPLTEHPIYCGIVCLIYIYAVNFFINDMMENREPMKLYKILIFYNFGMVIGNVWLHYEFWMSGWGTEYNFVCENINYEINPKTMRMANLMWWYYISKFIDMFDTVFMALRKQRNKITFLHYFHHLSMPGNAYVLIRFLPGGHCTFHGLLNSFVHIWMYLYYGLAALGPTYRKYLWWKKYVTLCQLVQFYLDCIHLVLPFYYDCGFPKFVLAYMFGQAIVFLGLFTRFYIRTYVVVKKNTYQNGHAN